jgi:hypothetical protein
MIQAGTDLALYNSKVGNKACIKTEIYMAIQQKGQQPQQAGQGQKTQQGQTGMGQSKVQPGQNQGQVNRDQNRDRVESPNQNQQAKKARPLSSEQDHE